ncbi:MAG TPA: S46 family peptidase [Pyrinomonadaceae bacterium]|nr:S46 family peptidase [Pyrinomonadaceae bacterium]
MNIRKLLRAGFAALLAISTLSAGVRADEGMWTFNNVPKAEIKKRYGFDVSDVWLKKVQTASVRFNNGGSGSFVSADGLVMTNHHIASDTLAKLSTAQKDLVKEGFYARNRAEEAKAPDLELNVLVSIEDVTARVSGAVKEGMSAADANAARGAAINAISEESTKATGLRSDVVTLYQGGQYNLYRYKKYTDVRLVFAPEFTIAFFGGDPDNFTFPRYCLDLALFRVYENDQPVKVENYFKWSKAGTKDGELTFVSGHPGTTQRLNTVAHLDYLRDTGQPLLLKYLERSRGTLNKYGALGEEQARRSQEDLFSVENSLKAITGQQQGLEDKALMARKGAAEEKLRKAIAADEKKKKEYGDAWDAIVKARRGQPAYERERRFLESGWGFNSELFQTARTLVRLAEEDAKANGERLPEYASAGRESLELNLYSPAPIYDDFETIKLADSLAFMRDELGAANPTVQKVLAGKTPEARAAELVQGTKLKDVEYRKQLAAGGAKAIADSTDPMIVLARSIDAESRAVRKRYESEVIGVERGAYAKIARANFDTEGTKVYPDATFTLRLSYGAVKGYKEDGKQITPYTNFAGLYERAAKNGDKFPYQLPQSWVKAKSALNLQTPFNFVTTNDIVGGNSGSPVFNRNAEIVGLVFDGNIQSLVGSFSYDESVNRTVAVDSRGMIEALRKVYGADEVADELMK